MEYLDKKDDPKWMAIRIKELEKENDQLKNIHNIAGNLVDTVNLLAEIDDRISDICPALFSCGKETQKWLKNSKDAGALEALNGLRDWICKELA
jgi:hypothetical protein